MQSPLVEYNFRVVDLFEDLQDGVRLCRAIQLLQHDSSILLVARISSYSNIKDAFSVQLSPFVFHEFSN